jgi:WhiB family redox-sensing transcriptional regulator
MTTSAQSTDTCHPSTPGTIARSNHVSLWRERANCHARDREDFFPEERDFKNKTDTALELCATCPVRVECLKQAEETPERFGIRGGKTAAQRGWDSAGKRLKTPPHRLGSGTAIL